MGLAKYKPNKNSYIFGAYIRGLQIFKPNTTDPQKLVSIVQTHGNISTRWWMPLNGSARSNDPLFVTLSERLSLNGKVNISSVFAIYAIKHPLTLLESLICAKVISWDLSLWRVWISFSFTGPSFLSELHDRYGRALFRKFIGDLIIKYYLNLYTEVMVISGRNIEKQKNKSCAHSVLDACNATAL